MPAPIPTSLATILPKITARLADVTGVSSNRVLLLARPDTPHFQGDSDLLVRVSAPLPDDGFAHGAGRHGGVVVRRTVQVTPRVRSAHDQGDRDDAALTSAAGLLPLEESVVNALHVWVPTSGDDWLAIEPMHWRPGGQPVHPTPVHQSWLHSDLVFEIRHILSVSDNGF